MARVAGWLMLLGGVGFALGLGLLVYALSTITVALAFASPVVLVALVSAVALLRSGRLLTRSGAGRERTTHDQALLELAAHRGPVTANEAARALGISADDADGILTDLAKREPDRVVVEFDDDGVIRYRAVNALEVPAAVHVRVDPRVRVSDGGARGDAMTDAEGESAAPLQDPSNRAALRR